MKIKTLAAAASAFAALAIGSSAFAQTCPCSASATQVATQAAMTSLFANKMACGNIGGEIWQEWHNGTTSGPVIDYKKGPGDPVDPPSQTGTYQINADATITYTYGTDAYRYAVCNAPTDYVFCGAAFGGRNITGVRVGGTGGLQNCATVTSAKGRSTLKN